MGRRPIVGVTTAHREGAERPAFSLPAAYVDALREVGAAPVLLPPGDPDPGRLLEPLDGVVFGGGGDLDPELFEGRRHPETYAVCPERDAFELALLRAALASEIPTLAICRGMQVLNVACGGTLCAHLPEAVGERVRHRESQRRHVEHEVHLEPGSRLAAVLGTTRLTIASWHHQAVERLGEGLRAVAWAADGTVEALSYRDRPWLLAIQWHPELQRGPGSPQTRLLRAFTELAAGRTS